MLDIGWSEMAVIAILALIVIGPKDLPRVLRTVGQWVRKARSLGREFQSGIDEMIRESELDEARKAIQKGRHLDIDKALEDAIDPTGDVKEEVRSIDSAARGKQAGEEAGEPAKKEPVHPEETVSAEPKPDGEDGEAPTATVIGHPVRMAPPHSLTPPEDEPAEDASPTKDDSAEKRA